MTCYDVEGRVTARHSDGTLFTESGAWLARLLAVTGSATLDGGRTFQCPAHPDATPSLSLVGRDGPRRLPRCFAGCTVRDVARALRIPTAYLLRPPDVDPACYVAAHGVAVSYPVVQASGGPGRAGLRLEATHDYGAGFRLLRYRHPVTGRKAVEWERRSGNVWVPGLGGTPLDALPLYRELEAKQAVGAGELLVVVESESSVDALCKAGIYSVTWAGGATTPQLHRLALLRNHDRLLLVPDNDPPGLLCADRIREVLPRATTLLPPPGQDARDLLDTRGPKAFKP